MAETKKKGTMKAMIDGTLSDVMVKTNVENVVYSTGGDGSEVMLSTKMAEILGSDNGKSVRTIANEELTKQLIPAGAQESLNTLAEIAAWIQAHPDDAASMNQAISALQTKVNTGSKTVTAYVTDAINALKIGNYAKASQLTALASRVTTLEGSDNGKSVRTIANEELAKQLIPTGAQESLNTLAEIAAWIQAHPGDAASMNQAIGALKTKVNTGDKTVTAYVTDAINALKIGDYAKASQLTALAARVTTLEGQGKIYISATQPAKLKAGDLWLQVL